MRTGTDLLRTMLFTIALALALGSAASAAQLFHGGAQGVTVQVDDRSRSAQNDDGEDRDDEDEGENEDSGDKGDKNDEQGQQGQHEHGENGESEGEEQD